MEVCENVTNIQMLREWAPLTDLFNKLPVKVQIGLFTQDVKLTCIDVLPEFIALGTNLGVVYWYDRKKKDLQRLRCEKQNIEISVVKVISTVDYMVACGNRAGNINIFQIPKSHPDSIPESLRPKNKQVERYSVSELHKSAVTALEWSKNGMKLFSGDKTGCIVFTEIDFYMHICKSLEILNEAYEVVQLSYTQQRLLVSTTYRSIICEKHDKWRVCQVGKKDRKILGKFGGIIYQNGHKANDSLLYCSRPRLRIWISDLEGNVIKTLLFKDLLSKECLEVPIINPIPKSLKMSKTQMEPSFGTILPFSDNLLVTYSRDVIYILNPEEMTIISTMSHFRNVLWVATCKDEIFILEEERSLIRISYKPEPSYGVNLFDSSMESTFLSNSIKDLTSKLQSSRILPAISPFIENVSGGDVDIHTDYSLVMNAEEAKESPVKSRINREIEKKFNDIGKQEFSEKILFKQSKQQQKKKNIMSASFSSLSSTSSDEKEAHYLKPTLMTLSSVGVLPDLRSPESIQNDIEYKEKILADVLNFDKVKISLDKLKNTNTNIDEIDKVTLKSDIRDNVNYSESNIAVINNASILPKANYDQIIVAEKFSTHKNNINSDEDNFATKSSGSPTKVSCASKIVLRDLAESSPHVLDDTTPACFDIPNEWKLSTVQLNVKGDTSLSDTSLADWEII